MNNDLNASFNDILSDMLSHIYSRMLIKYVSLKTQLANIQDDSNRPLGDPTKEKKEKKIPLYRTIVRLANFQDDSNRPLGEPTKKNKKRNSRFIGL